MPPRATSIESKPTKQITNSATSYGGPKLWNEIPRSETLIPFILLRKGFGNFYERLDKDTFLF